MSEIKTYIYDYDNFSFKIFVGDYWEKIYKGKPRNKLYHDYQVMLNLVKNVSKEKVIVDVGVNNGLFAIPASMMGYTVVGFEPISETLNNIQSARIENNLSNFHIYHLALSNENGKKDIYVPECPDNASFSEAAAVANMKRKDCSVQNVYTTRFDDWIKWHPDYQNIGFIKIDAQGAEFDIISGMKEFLTNASGIYLIAEYEPHLLKMGHSYSELDELIISLGFQDQGRICGNDKLFKK